MSVIFKKILLLLLAINVLYVLTGAIFLPMESVDVVGIWMFKAKAFFVEGGLPLFTLKNPDFLLFHPQYPVLLPALYSLIYFALGRVWELPVLLLYPVYYVAILWLVWRVSRQLQLNSLWSLVYVYIYSMLSPLIGQAGRGHAGSADIVIVLLSWFAVWIFLGKWPTFNKAIWLTVVAMMASQIKLEGLFIAATLVVLPLSFMSKSLFLSVALLPTLLWMLAVRWLSIPVDFSFVLPNIPQLLERGWLIAKYSLIEMSNFRNWYTFWPLCWGSIVLSAKSAPALTQLAKVATLMSAGFGLVYLNTTVDPEAHIASSIDRVLFQLTPFVFPVFMVKMQALLRIADRKLKPWFAILH